VKSRLADSKLPQPGVLPIQIRTIHLEFLHDFPDLLGNGVPRALILGALGEVLGQGPAAKGQEDLQVRVLATDLFQRGEVPVVLVIPVRPRAALHASTVEDLLHI